MIGRPRKHIPLDKVCQHCGSAFRATSRYAILVQTYCSTECNQKHRGKGQFKPLTPTPCHVCQTVMQLLPREVRVGKRFCSTSCSSRFHNQGENNPAWKGGRNNRGAFWKQRARERDGYQCQFRGCPAHGEGKHIHAHHRIPRSAGGEDCLSNLITLCAKHHREIERQLLMYFLSVHPTEVRAALEAIYAASCPDASHLPRQAVGSSNP